MIRKISIIIICITLIICFSGCYALKVLNMEYDWKFLHDTSEIVTVEKGILYKIYDDSKFIRLDIEVEETLDKEEMEAFIQEIKETGCSSVWNDPPTLSGDWTDDCEAIKISYKNGDYQLIGPGATGKYEKGRYSDYGWYFYGKSEFEVLINKFFD